MDKTRTIWRITDGKRGHENQSAGLFEALGRRISLDVIDLPTERCGRGWWNFLLGRFPAAEGLAPPDLIVAAGSRTHLSLLAAGRKTGAPTVLMMAPALCLRRFFSLCVIPQHDQVSGSNILTTTGALNRVRPGSKDSEKTGLILIGGPSAHHGWSSDEMVRQVRAVVEADPSIHWTLSTSRRTPRETTRPLIELARVQRNLEVLPIEETSPDWLPEQLSRAPRAWVSEDSVSMVYEALSSGAEVGLLSVPRLSKNSRVLRGLDDLIASGSVFLWNQSPNPLNPRPGYKPLQEADRVADIVLKRFLK